MHLWKGAKKFGSGPPPPPHLDKIQKKSSFFRVPFPYEGAKTASRVEGGFVLGINYPYKRGWSKLRSNRRSVFWSICNMFICEICKYLRLITINVLGWPVEGLSSPLLTRTAKHPFFSTAGSSRNRLRGSHPVLAALSSENRAYRALSIIIKALYVGRYATV